MSSPPEPPPAEPPAAINIRNLSVKCGACGEYQKLSAFARRQGWHVYTYECENGVCDRAVTRTLVEVPAELDEFARRDPGWSHEDARREESA